MIKGLAGLIAIGVTVVAPAWIIEQSGAQQPAEKAPASITVDYPAEGSVFPPDMTAPAFEWRDPVDTATEYQIDVSFADGSLAIRVNAPGERMRVGEIDPRCIAPNNELPKLTPKQAEARTWRPDEGAWEETKKRSVTHPATVTITGYRDSRPVSRGQVRIRTSKDPVGAPIFYRDVPLMPSQLEEKGVVKPLNPKLLPYVAWRLRHVGEPRSRVVMDGIHTCANCHSFSRDGKTLGLDLDGPHNDKGLYAIVPVATHMSIRNEDVISWRTFREQSAQDKRIGFMSQVSPDGRYIVTATQVEYYVANFMDYRFLQVFYPTRGILAWYSREDGRMRPVPGADDPRYVQANAVWSPDGKYLVFARAEAKDSYPAGRKTAEFANDPNEVPIQYDLYRIPFNDGKGGHAEPVRGASQNGMSNSFPKVSPDGRWIVFVKSRNGQLMRPDGQLYIVPATGGEARRMRCNTPVMNSWHSFSPNGRWLVFSSKSRSPYTQLFLTHIDEDGNDSPAILIEDSTAANRAVNIPEFVNVARGGMMTMDAPAAEFYRLYDSAFDLTERGQVAAATAEWKKALELNPDDTKALTNFGAVLLRQGRLDEAEVQFRKALQVNPEFVPARNNVALLRMQQGKIDGAIAEWQKSLELKPDSTEARVNLGVAFVMRGRFGEALAQFREALRLEPDNLPIVSNVAWMLATCRDGSTRNGAEAVRLAERGLQLSGGRDPRILDILGAAYAEAGRFPEAIERTQQAAALAVERGDHRLAKELKGRIELYKMKRAFREAE